MTAVSKPIYAPSETTYDLWLGYERRISRKITWGIQLNVYDLFAESELIPIMAKPDGTVAQVRIPRRTTCRVTKSFRFG